MAVLEEYLSDDKLINIQRTRVAYHKDFRLALVGQRFAARNLTIQVDEVRMAPLLDRWRTADRLHFVVLSGYWLPTLNHLLPSMRNYSVELLHIDSYPSISWKEARLEVPFKDIWWASWDCRKVLYRMAIEDDSIVGFDCRDNKMVVHGGGWGLGSYHTCIPTITNAEFSVDLVTYSVEDHYFSGRNITPLKISADWQPWTKGPNGEFLYPPIAGDNHMTKSGHSHELYRRIRTARAIVSKPGGATLLESFSSATPVLFTEPYGEHEKRNAELWIYLGFGAWFDDWKSSRCSIHFLEALYKNIYAYRETVPNIFVS
jgi:hypothetical protein